MQGETEGIDCGSYVQVEYALATVSGTWPDAPVTGMEAPVVNGREVEAVPTDNSVVGEYSFYVGYRVI